MIITERFRRNQNAGSARDIPFWSFARYDGQEQTSQPGHYALFVDFLLP
jgi:hypothetical protein